MTVTHRRTDHVTSFATGFLALMLVLASCGSSASPAASPSAAPSAPSGASAPAASGGYGVGGGAASPWTAASGSSLAEQLEQQFVSVVQTGSAAVVVIQTSSGLRSGVVFDTQADSVNSAPG